MIYSVVNICGNYIALLLPVTFSNSTTNCIADLTESSRFFAKLLLITLYGEVCKTKLKEREQFIFVIELGRINNTSFTQSKIYGN